MTKLYVGNLSEEVTEKSLTELFDSFGDVNEVAVFKDKGFGFVHFFKQEDADAALDALDNTKFLGETIVVQFSRTKGHGYGRGSGPPRPRGARRGFSRPPPGAYRRDRPYRDDYRDSYRDSYHDSYRERDRGRYYEGRPSRDFGGRGYRGRDSRRYGGGEYYDKYGGGRYDHDRGYDRGGYYDDYSGGGGSKYSEYRGRSRSPPASRDYYSREKYDRDPYERSSYKDGYREEGSKKRSW